MNLFQKLCRGVIFSVVLTSLSITLAMAGTSLTQEEIELAKQPKGPGAALLGIEITSTPEEATTTQFADIITTNENGEITIVTAEAQQEEADRIAAEEAARKAAEEAARKAAEEEARRQAELESRKQYLGKFTLTAYCSCKKCCGRWSPEVTGKPSTTESGTHPVQGRTVAVDKSVIPLGTHIMINGHEYIAEDTGSAVDGNHIDVYFSSHAEARNFGMKKGIDVYRLR